MADQIVLLPILNKRVVTFRGPGWSLAKDVIVKTISDEHFTASYKFGHNVDKFIKVDTKCIQFTGLGQNPSADTLRRAILCTAYVLTHFAQDLPPAFVYALMASAKSKKTEITKMYQVPEYLSGVLLLDKEHKLKANVKAQELSALFSLMQSSLR